MTTVIRIEKSDEVLEFIKHSHLFKTFCDNLPNDTRPEDLEIKIKHIPKQEDERWEKMSTGEITRVFKGNIRSRHEEDHDENIDMTKDIVKKVEYYEDGSHSTVIYRDRD